VVDLAELIKTVGTMLESAVDALIEIDVTIDPDTWPINVDAGELELALVNIVLNARDAMPDGGRISLEAANVHLAARDTVSAVEGQFVALRLTDTGTGIAPDMLDKVFDPFFTTKPVGKGTGLGLSQVYGFAYQSGGTVTVDSLLGHGTSVTLYLPRAPQAAGVHRHKSEAPSSQGGGKVLLVEDNPDVAEVSALMLEQAGYAPRRVADADQALQALENEDFDLVISDIVMPGRYDGLTLARLLRETKPDLPVILVSGYAGEAGEASLEFTVLRKPFRFSQLSQTVALIMAGR
jgi:CheY-like chemotaxis protein